MKKVQAYFLLCCIFASTQLIAQSYQKTNLGIKTTTQSMTVEIQFYSPTIVRVLRLPEGVASAKTSLSVIRVC